MELLGSIPTGWDITLIPAGQAGEYIITARRNEDDWWVAGITDSAARQLPLSLSFLPAGTYTATLCTGGINADRNAIDYAIEEKKLTPADSLMIHMAPGGGFLVRLRKE